MFKKKIAEKVREALDLSEEKDWANTFMGGLENTLKTFPKNRRHYVVSVGSEDGNITFEGVQQVLDADLREEGFEPHWAKKGAYNGTPLIDRDWESL